MGLRDARDGASSCRRRVRGDPGPELTHAHSGRRPGGGRDAPTCFVRFSVPLRAEMIENQSLRTGPSLSAGSQEHAPPPHAPYFRGSESVGIGDSTAQPPRPATLTGLRGCERTAATSPAGGFGLLPRERWHRLALSVSGVYGRRARSSPDDEIEIFPTAQFPGTGPAGRSPGAQGDRFLSPRSCGGTGLGVPEGGTRTVLPSFTVQRLQGFVLFFSGIHSTCLSTPCRFGSKSAHSFSFLLF